MKTRPIFSIATFCKAVEVCVYTSSVKSAEEWPAMLCTTEGSVPCRSASRSLHLLFRLVQLLLLERLGLREVYFVLFRFF